MKVKRNDSVVVISGKDAGKKGKVISAFPAENRIKVDGVNVQKKSKKGKKFFGCEKYPDCDFVTWDTPVEDKCPKCNDGTTLFKKGGKMFCRKEGCGYEVEIKKEK